MAGQTDAAGVSGLPSADSLFQPKPWEGNPAKFISEQIGSPVRLTSGHRDPAHNAAVGGVPDSGHLGYDTFDFVPQGMTTAQAAEALAQSGVPYDQIIQEGDHVHVQFGGRRRGQVLGRLATPPLPKAEKLFPDPLPKADALFPEKNAAGQPLAPRTPVGVKQHPRTIVDQVLGGVGQAVDFFDHQIAQDYHERVDPDRQAIVGDVAAVGDPKNPQNYMPMLFGLTPNETKVALDFGNMLWDQTGGVLSDEVIGHAVNKLTGGRVGVHTAGDIASLAMPFGEAKLAEAVIAKGARAMDMSTPAYQRFLAERSAARSKLATARKAGYSPIYREGETTGPKPAPKPDGKVGAAVRRAHADEGRYDEHDHASDGGGPDVRSVDEILGPEPNREPSRRAAAERSDDVLYERAKADVKEHRSAIPKDETILGAIRRLGGIKSTDAKGIKEDFASGLDKKRLQPGVINNRTGLAPDDIRGLLQDEGWFGAAPADPHNPAGSAAGERKGDSIGDLTELIGQEVAGKPVYHPTSRVRDALSRRDQLERELGDAGVQPTDDHATASRKLAAHRGERDKLTDLQIRADELGVQHGPDTTHEQLLGDVLERLAIHHEATGEDWLTSAEHGERMIDDHLTPEEHEWLSRGAVGQQDEAGGHGETDRGAVGETRAEGATPPLGAGAEGGGDNAGEGGGIGGGGGDDGGDGYFPGDMPEPGSPEHAGPVVGDEAEPETRLDNALYRLGGHATADKLEALKFLKGLPKALRDPKVQEELGHEIEQRLIDPDHEIPAHLKPAYDAFEKYRDEVDERLHRLHAMNDPTLEPFLPESGYTPRRAKGHTPIFDENDPNAEVHDPVLGKRSLSKDSPSQHSRTAGWVQTTRDGRAYFTREPPVADAVDDQGRPFASTRQATMAEIEANTDIRYYNNPLINTIDEALRLRRVERNIQVLEEIKSNLKLEGLAHQEEFYDPERGGWFPAKSNRERPDNFVRLDHIPQLRGWSFDRRIAEVLKDYYPGDDEPVDQMIAKVNRLMIAGLFITPFIHGANVWGHWTVGRGWDWIRDPLMLRLMKTGTQAMAEVWTKGPKYRQLLREGNGLLYGDTQVRNFHQLMLEKAGVEITGDPETWKQFSETFHLKELGLGNIKDFLNLYYRSVQKGLWMASDMFMMQRVLELEEKGKSVRAAIKDTEKDIPNYRVPSRVFGSREAAQVLKNGQWVVFGRYKYGQWNAISRMIDDMVGAKSSQEDRVEAVGKLLVAGVVLAGVIPAANTLLQEVTHNKDARIRPPGPFAIADAIWQFATGKKDWAVATSSLISPSPIVEIAAQVKQNRDFFGRKIIEEQSTPLGMGVQAAEYASGPLYPLALLEETLKPGGVADAAGKVIGLDIPPEGTSDIREHYHQLDKVHAAKREQRDKLQQKIQAAIDSVSR